MPVKNLKLELPDRTVHYSVCVGGAMYTSTIDDAMEIIRHYDFKKDNGEGIGIYVDDQDPKLITDESLLIQVTVDKS